MTDGRFRHEAFFYAGEADFVEGVTKFAEQGLDAGSAVLVAVPEPRLAALRDVLSSHGDRISFVDITVAGRNPGRLLPGLLGEFAEAHAGRPLSIVGEPIWAARTPAERAVAVQHEALVNLAFAGQDATALCPYDRNSLGPSVLADAERTHPVLRTLERSWTSPAYTDPARLAREIGPVGEVPADARSVHFDGRTLAGVREIVESFGVEHGLPPGRAEELRLAAHEIAMNSVTHAGGRGRVRLWCDGERVICEIADEGCFVDDLAGRLPAAPDAVSGRGLLLANFLCDLVEVGRTETGTTVRLHVSPEGCA